MKTTNVVLLVLGVFWAAFIVTMVAVYCVTGGTPDTLIQCVLGGSGVEVAALTAIKISKVRFGQSPGEGEDHDSPV